MLATNCDLCWLAISSSRLFWAISPNRRAFSSAIADWSLLNLVGNAIKFTDGGEVRIAAGAENGHFALSVSDTGPGIPADECETIFEKFRQVDSSNTRAKGGTGLGLAIAREIVEMHGGRIWVESTLGQGSTFRMQLPVRAAALAHVGNQL
jgi:signal transduction histidine kinase